MWTLLLRSARTWLCLCGASLLLLSWSAPWMSAADGVPVAETVGPTEVWAVVAAVGLKMLTDLRASQAHRTAVENLPAQIAEQIKASVRDLDARTERIEETLGELHVEVHDDLVRAAALRAAGQ